jgi:hypothetical protein
MSLLDVLRSGIKTADQVTKPLQAPVQFSHCTGSDAFGEPTYDPAVPLTAIVEWEQKAVGSQSGIVISSRITVLFLDVKALAAATGPEGITTKDKIVLPGGETGPIVGLEGFLDALTGEPVTVTAYLE